MKSIKVNIGKKDSVFLSFCLVIMVLMVNCTGRKEMSKVGFSVEMRQNAATNEPIVFSEEITRIEYVPLELTSDGTSMLAEAMDLSITEDFIFVNSMKQGGIFQFSRADGKFIRKFAPTGNGPGETQLILNIYADEATREVFIVQPHNTLKYTFDGEFVASRKQPRPISLKYPVEDNRVAELGAEFVPFNTPELIGMGIYTLEDDVVAEKNDFARPDIVPTDNSCIKDVRSAFSDKSVLYFMASNDTVFRLSSTGIQRAFVLDRQNSRECLEGSLTPKKNNMLPNNFWVYDFFETAQSFYVRAIYNDKMHLFALDKSTGVTTAEISEVNPHEIFGYDCWMQGIGIHIKEGEIPLWVTKSYPEKNILVQYMPTAELFYLKEKSIIDHLPSEIAHIDEESNPVVIIYHLNKITYY